MTIPRRIWEERFSKTHNKYYHYNTKTKKSKWSNKFKEEHNNLEFYYSKLDQDDKQFFDFKGLIGDLNEVLKDINFSTDDLFIKDQIVAAVKYAEDAVDEADTYKIKARKHQSSSYTSTTATESTTPKEKWDKIAVLHHERLVEDLEKEEQKKRRVKMYPIKDKIETDEAPEKKTQKPGNAKMSKNQNIDPRTGLARPKTRKNSSPFTTDTPSLLCNVPEKSRDHHDQNDQQNYYDDRDRYDSYNNTPNKRCPDPKSLSNHNEPWSDQNNSQYSQNDGSKSSHLSESDSEEENTYQPIVGKKKVQEKERCEETQTQKSYAKINTFFNKITNTRNKPKDAYEEMRNNVKDMNLNPNEVLTNDKTSNRKILEASEDIEDLDTRMNEKVDEIPQKGNYYNQFEAIQQNDDVNREILKADPTPRLIEKESKPSFIEKESKPGFIEKEREPTQSRPTYIYESERRRIETNMQPSETTIYNTINSLITSNNTDQPQPTINSKPKLLKRQLNYSESSNEGSSNFKTLNYKDNMANLDRMRRIPSSENAEHHRLFDIAERQQQNDRATERTNEQGRKRSGEYNEDNFKRQKSEVSSPPIRNHKYSFEREPDKDERSCLSPTSPEPTRVYTHEHDENEIKYVVTSPKSNPRNEVKRIIIEEPRPRNDLDVLIKSPESALRDRSQVTNRLSPTSPDDTNLVAAISKELADYKTFRDGHRKGLISEDRRKDRRVGPRDGHIDGHRGSHRDGHRGSHREGHRDGHRNDHRDDHRDGHRNNGTKRDFEYSAKKSPSVFSRLGSNSIGEREIKSKAVHDTEYM